MPKHNPSRLHTLPTEIKHWAEDGGVISLLPAGHQVFYKDIGSPQASAEQTLLIIHGFPESSFSFSKVIDGLTTRFQRIVLLDMIGYGLSDKPTTHFAYSLIEQADVVMQVWQHLKVRGGHVLAHDMGTSVLTELVARHINRQLPADFDSGFQSLTFTNGSMVLDMAKLRFMQKLLLSKAGAWVSKFSSYTRFEKTVISAHGVNAVNDKNADAKHSFSQDDARLMWQNMCLQDGHKKTHLLIQYLLDRQRYEKTRWLPALNKIDKQMPMHICWGDADQVARVEMAHYLTTQVCPSANLSLMPGVGHFCQIASPQTWCRSVTDFYAKH